ncbi:4-(cytidine 5'-diphospho)-2-C-methyl-D-erythritol kinase [Psychrobacter sp. LV10R520-6]|uniref:4-(cytidine 5'-diphospho)-2-C-methyl-D-erythritol kinase n=1 Tax=Psychrobacter sp. LV10R520-6 TaxID=1415574 RepID=UPI0024C72816|nr:4-(cytidine 5'-diphospho)-2-C-methyl-D-erythritol kinase [Psychrobacter sp. LV10R520-6]SNT71307.1 4-diphosphocytidyl-2-C-methyl-D-erythritol kinase [Psychrobacter sp. LV10R520-6]
MIKNMAISHAPVTRLSPAKINLFLHITGRRADGYHNLQTVFRLLDWGDYLHFLPADLLSLSTTDINIDKDVDTDFNASVTHLSEDSNLPERNVPDLSTAAYQQAAALSNKLPNKLPNKLCNQLVSLTGAETITDSLADNLIIKAARALLAYALQLGRLPIQLPHVSITLDKHLPMGAGLGGGSSNAAITLLVLNELWQLEFTNKQLCDIGATLGADVPIFIFGQDAIAMGIGEQLTPIELPNQQYLLLTPNAHVNTAQLFAHPKLRRDIKTLTATTISEQSACYIQALNAPYHNVFTPVVESLAPAVSRALQYLRELEPQALGIARMTGSGSAVFLPLDPGVTDDIQMLTSWIAGAPCPAYLVNNLRG